ncbi:DUF3466 family protein [Photobacterium swingsii]|uniref:DUF3466 family protein n=1 Tax=Photobacterium swingsii TaxID=680026 RepID=UPI00406894A0
MRQNMLKLSTLAILIAGVTNANAAVYKIVEVDETGSGLSEVNQLPYYNNDKSNRTETYGQAILPSDKTANCFDGSCGDGNAYTVVGESRFGVAGIEYRDEVAFTSDIYQEINDVSTLDNYCKNNLGFNTCGTWADTRYFGTLFNADDAYDETGFGGLLREQVAFRKGYTRNSFLLVKGQPTETFAETASKYNNTSNLGTLVANSMNSVPNGITRVASNDVVYGVTSSAYFSNSGRFSRQFAKRGFIQSASGSFELTPPLAGSTKLAQIMGTSAAWGAVVDPVDNGNLLVVGSAAFSESYLDDDKKLPSKSDLKIDGIEQGLSTNSLRNCTEQANKADFSGLYNTWECQFTMFSNDAYLWVVNPDGVGADKPIRIAKNDSRAPYNPKSNKKEQSFQAAARAISIVGNKPYIVGSSTQLVRDDNFGLRAAVYSPKASVDFTQSLADDSWEIKFIGPDLYDGDKRQYTFSVATDINENNKVVGIAKLDRSESRSYAERMFIYDNNKNEFKFLDSSVSGLFFDGSNGYTSSINNNDVLVGKLDSETANQVDGRQRRQRGFLYNAGSDIAGSPLKAGGAWFLDDLTNDGTVSGTKVANSYRIAEATDINDAGVISATALYCDGGYDKLTQESTCKGGEKNSERVVAVKLVPIQNGDIQTRPAEETEIKRNGASLGMFALTLLGFIGFRRRK